MYRLLLDALVMSSELFPASASTTTFVRGDDIDDSDAGAMLVAFSGYVLEDIRLEVSPLTIYTNIILYQMGATQSEVDMLTQACRDLKRSQADLMIRMDNLDASRDRLTTQFTNRHEKMLNELMVLKQDYAIEIHQLDEEYDELRHQMNDIKTSINNLRDMELSHKSIRSSFSRRKRQ